MNTNSVRVAIKSPEYLPRLSYVALMQSVDVFVLADTFQYSRQSYQNRTRVRTPQGAHWISIPLEGRQHGRPINETRIDNRTHWQSKHLRSILFNYSQTPYFAFIEESIKKLYTEEWDVLGALTCQSVGLIHEMFQMKCRLVQASTLEGCPGSPQEVLEVITANEWVTDHAQEVIDAGGGISSSVLEFSEPIYRQHFEGFEPNITALDLLCNYGPEALSILSTVLKQ